MFVYVEIFVRGCDCLRTSGSDKLLNKVAIITGGDSGIVDLPRNMVGMCIFNEARKQ